jgi:hypothetical protein
MDGQTNDERERVSSQAQRALDASEREKERARIRKAAAWKGFVKGVALVLVLLLLVVTFSRGPLFRTHKRIRDIGPWRIEGEVNDWAGLVRLVITRRMHSCDASGERHLHPFTNLILVDERVGESEAEYMAPEAALRDFWDATRNLDPDIEQELAQLGKFLLSPESRSFIDNMVSEDPPASTPDGRREEGKDAV